MKEKLEKRLAELKAEFESGQKVMAEYEAKVANLRDTLLRISGAIQILEEEISKENETDKENVIPEIVNAEKTNL
ncbi:MAG: hypothetical protein F6K40_34665 [Okeania sp. SIO3I5]|uniref:hypothetical protein n=1 Tax=Okeania sp. SIO3I5 TaxID=2607805 RepID=UPI0013B672BC|nr:hypothetical protein [Okeania sp. SIO3I5]NEQ41081.1 hypothetical protein [Okeania sp. SIO3I5]